MALVLTIMAVSFLVAITVQVATSVNWQMQGAGNLRDSVQLDAMNRSGLSLVRAALLADSKDNNVDTPHDSWQKLGSEDMPSLFGSGRLAINVTDLSGLLQVNALVPDEKNPRAAQKIQRDQKEMWIRFLTSGRFSADGSAEIETTEAEEIVDSIIDWIDENDLEEDHGAESGYYLTQSPSYKARNGPITYPEELLLIRGMTKEIFYGNEEYEALSEYITIAGRDGKININSAPAEILMLLDINMTRETADELIEFREDEVNQAALANPQWYLQVNPTVEMSRSIIDVRSRHFKVSVLASYNSMRRQGTGILSREDNGEQSLLYWEVR